MSLATTTSLATAPACDDERALLSQYFAFAEAAARDRGVRLTIHTDFERLRAINKRNANNWASLSPIFDPRCGALGDDNAFWIDGTDRSGETVLTTAARFYDHRPSSLAEDLRSLRVFYDRPASLVAAGERIEVNAPAAEQIRGTAVYSGAVWVRPDYRRLGFSKIIPRLARAYALARWQPPVFWGTIKPALDQAGLTQAYGSWQIGGRLAFRMPSWREDFDLLFLWMDRTTLVADIHAGVVQATTDSSRRSDTLMTNISDGQARQGSSTRS
jgi:hypothetical protein